MKNIFKKIFALSLSTTFTLVCWSHPESLGYADPFDPRNSNFYEQGENDQVIDYTGEYGIYQRKEYPLLVADDEDGVLQASALFRGDHFEGLTNSAGIILRLPSGEHEFVRLFNYGDGHPGENAMRQCIESESFPVKVTLLYECLDVPKTWTLVLSNANDFYESFLCLDATKIQLRLNGKRRRENV